jgi:hypothetical protein
MLIPGVRLRQIPVEALCDRRKKAGSPSGRATVTRLRKATTCQADTPLQKIPLDASTRSSSLVAHFL